MHAILPGVKLLARTRASHLLTVRTRGHALMLAAVSLSMATGCTRTAGPRKDPAGAAPSSRTTTASANAQTSAPAPTPAAPKSGACAVEPQGGVPIPASSRASDVRIAAAGARALVTFWETTKSSDGPDVLSAQGHVFDATAASVSPRITIERSAMGDEPISGAAPVAVGSDLHSVSCVYGAPAGRYVCTRAAPGDAKAKALFTFSGIAFGGPTNAGIAAVAKGDDTVVFVPESNGKDVLVFSARASAKKTSYPFGMPSDGLPVADGLAAALSGEDEASVVYRFKGAVLARRAGFDQAWRGSAIPLSAKGALVGAPAVAHDGARLAAVFSQRRKASDPWRVVLASLGPSGEVTSDELPTGDLQAQGPGIARTAQAGCFLVSWVEGTGKGTRTRLGRACDGRIAPASITTLSAEGIEGGRAYLAVDPADPASAFVTWQELPTGKPAELRVGKLACR